MKTGDIVPCGKCPQCRKRRASAWSFRLLQEDKRSDSSIFLTLTYAPEHLPRTRNNYRTLKADDLQLYFKKLRRRHETVYGYPSVRRDVPLRYYAVGEYGGKFKRPHYHIILFNANPELAMACWDKGHTHYGTVSAKSVGYVLKYVSDDGWRPYHKNDDRLPQFSRMSKNLGDNYLTRSMCRWHYNKLTQRCYCNIEGGKKIAMPRYYKLKIYTQGERKYIAETITKKLEKNQKVYELREVLTSNEAQYERHRYRSKLNQSF